LSYAGDWHWTKSFFPVQSPEASDEYAAPRRDPGREKGILCIPDQQQRIWDLLEGYLGCRHRLKMIYKIIGANGSVFKDNRLELLETNAALKRLQIKTA
jgi:hypothetical protein